MKIHRSVNLMNLLYAKMVRKISKTAVSNALIKICKEGDSNW